MFCFQQHFVCLKKICFWNYNYSRLFLCYSQFSWLKFKWPVCLCDQVMFIQNKGEVTLTIELLDTEEAQADDPLDVQVRMFQWPGEPEWCQWVNSVNLVLSVPVQLHGAVCGNRVQSVLTGWRLLLQTRVSAQVRSSVWMFPVLKSVHSRCVWFDSKYNLKK